MLWGCDGMFTLKIENRFGDVLELTHNKNYVVTKIDGLNPPKAKINLSDIAGMNGSLFNSAKAETRNIVLTVLPQNPVERNRLALYKYAQVAQWCKIYYSNGSVDVQIEGYVETVEGSLFSRPQSFQISIICPQPYFEGLHEIYNDISSLVANFEFPFSIDSSGVEFSYVNHDVLSTVTNIGDVETGLSIYITARGEVVNPVIYDATSGGSIGLNVTLQNRDQVIINTNSGSRSVKLVSGATETNIIDKVDPDPTWFILHPGENIFSYDADSGVDLMFIVFRHRTKYGGV